MSIVKRSAVHSNQSGPNLIIELNYWHAQILVGFLQEFSGCADEIDHPLYGIPMHSIVRGSDSERAMCELFLNIKRCLDSD